MIGTKRERPMNVCSMCGKERPIVKHLNGDPSAPLCAACNMKLRRALASFDQVKAIKLAATVIGAMEQLLGLDLDSAEEQEIHAIQARIKIMASGWLGVKAVDTVGDPSVAERGTDPSANEHERSPSPSWPALTHADRDDKIAAGRRAYWEKWRAERDAKLQPQPGTATATVADGGGRAPISDE
jgi:hypothetical protein